MWYQINQYARFLIQSTNQHGLHSPFVYQLVTQCFYNKKRHLAYKAIKNYRNELKRNHLELEITDLGAGSKVLRSNKRKVSQILKHNSASLKRSKLLFRISEYFKSNAILELGTSLGVATQALSLGNPNAKITTVEGCPNIANFTQENFYKQELKNIRLITDNFDHAIDQFEDKTFDLIYLDGNHQKAPTIAYFESLLTHTHNDTVFVLDDIYWSKGMTEAWHIIKAHPKVTVTIDTFFCGFVFFRKEQEKEDFIIRV
ncbi:MAG: class I SAM-dependent methyltransferase [Flavobacteriaceae bacterium]|nr:class I SAM-dependent methyltransferase [Flavobacteriaceae bacterium]